MAKILFVTTSFENGAIPNILLALAPFWIKAGWDLSLLAIEPLPADHSSVKRWRALGLPIESLDRPAGAVFSVLGPLKKRIKSLAPDLIHTHLGRADIYVPWVKGKVPQISTFHSVRKNSGRLTQWGWKASDRIVAHRTGVSQACLDSFYSNNYLHSPHSVIYNPVDVARLTPSKNRAEVLASFGWSDPIKLLLAVGRLVPVKGHAELIAGFSQLLSTRPELRLVIVGDGPLEDSLRAQIQSLNLEKTVRLAGSWPLPGDLYHAADLLVFPSHWEGLGLVPLEALACGCPVASSRLPAVAEFLIDGKNGRFFEPGNPADLARVTGEMLDDLGEARRQALSGADLVRRSFSPELIASQYDELYRKVLHG